MSFDSRAFRDAMGQFATGVTIVATWDGDAVQAMTANAFTSVSLDPPLVLVCIARTARTHSAIERSGRFSVSVLPAGAEGISNYYAGRRDGGEAGEFDLERAKSPVLKGALSWVDCRVWQVYDGGDHSIFVGEVEALEVRGGDPLLFFSGKYRRLES